VIVLGAPEPLEQELGLAVLVEELGRSPRQRQPLRELAREGGLSGLLHAGEPDDEPRALLQFHADLATG